MSSPTVFHLTHPKAGSQWIKKILYAIAPDRTRMDANGMVAYFFAEPIRPGKIYPAIYTSRATFEAVLHSKRNWDNEYFVRGQKRFLSHHAFYLLNWIQFSLLGRPYKKFFIMRDLRDTLISLYFSMKKTHIIMRPEHATYRFQLTHSDQENGLIYLLGTEEFEDYSRIQLSWLEDPETLVMKFEDLIENPSLFVKIIEHCQLDVSRERLQQVLDANSFENLAGGRTRGVEDQDSHFRKGIAGDWKNYFTDRVKQAFLQRYGSVLIRTGYEKDEDW